MALGAILQGSVGGNEFQGAQKTDSGLDLFIRQFLIRCVRIRGEDEFHRVSLIQGEDPFGVEAAEAAEYTDVPEGSEYYDAVHYAVNNMLMGAVSDTEFGVDDPATLGEFLFGLSPVLLGSPMSAEETQAALVQYGLMTGDEKLDTELTEQFLCDFLNPLGAGMTTDTPDHVMTRGELAALLMQLGGK